MLIRGLLSRPVQFSSVMALVAIRVVKKRCPQLDMESARVDDLIQAAKGEEPTTRDARGFSVKNFNYTRTFGRNAPGRLPLQVARSYSAAST